MSRLVRLVYPPGDAVFQEGDIANEMFFIASGTVTIQYRGEHVSTLTTGGFFGEFALLEVCYELQRAENNPHTKYLDSTSQLCGVQPAPR